MNSIQRAKRANDRRRKYPPTPFQRLRQIGRRARSELVASGEIGRINAMRFVGFAAPQPGRSPGTTVKGVIRENRSEEGSTEAEGQPAQEVLNAQ